MADNNGALDWGDVISNDDAGEFQVAPEGDCTFTVRAVQRGRFKGSAKIPECNKAIITLDCEYPDGKKYTIAAEIILHTKLEWKISAFFRACGMKKHGEPLRMDWNGVIGRHGRCHVSVREWTGRDGNTYKSNDVATWYDAQDSSGFVETNDPNQPWRM